MSNTQLCVYILIHSCYCLKYWAVIKRGRVRTAVSGGKPFSWVHHWMLYLKAGSKPEFADFPVACNAVYVSSILVKRSVYICAAFCGVQLHGAWLQSDERLSRSKPVSSLLHVDVHRVQWLIIFLKCICRLDFNYGFKADAGSCSRSVSPQLAGAAELDRLPVFVLSVPLATRLCCRASRKSVLGFFGRWTWLKNQFDTWQ